MENSCLFCKIINQQIPSKKIAENDSVLVIEDVAPKAPIHYLILPKKHVVNIAAMTDDDTDTVNQTIKMAQQLSTSLNAPQAFNLIANNGEQAGQSVFHLHWHFLSGKNIYEESGFNL